MGYSEQLVPLSALGGVTAFVFWLYRGAWAQSRISVLSSEPPTEERGYSRAGREFPFQPVCAHRVVPRELQIWDFAGSLPAAGFPAGWDMAAPQLGTSSAALPSAMGLAHIKLGFWRVANPLISSETLEVRGRGLSPKHSCFLVSFDRFRSKSVSLL